VEEVDAEEIGHQRELWVVLQDLGDDFGGFYGASGALVEGG
jgi:hypothetical protein